MRIPLLESGDAHRRDDHLPTLSSADRPESARLTYGQPLHQCAGALLATHDHGLTVRAGVMT